jgi:tRNA dimethylallyltransferase
VTIVAIVGATGTGKSALSLELAAALGGEVVNADAMQLYRGMDVGTAKLSAAERRGIPHHLLDVLDPAEEASVARYQVEAREAIEQIEARGATPVLVGGSGLYVSSVIFDFRFPGTDARVRERLELELEERGPGILFQRLAELDDAAARSIGPHNGRRIVRALEVIEITGEPFGSGLPDENAMWRATTIIGLTSPRETLIARLDERVERMWADGIVAEAAEIGAERMGVTARRAIGYAQALAQRRGDLDERAAIAETQALTRKYARRQVSWFKRYPDTLWLDADDPQRVVEALSRVDK